MTSYEPMTLSNELAKDLGLKAEAQTKRMIVDLNFSGYYQICDRNWTIMSAYWRQNNYGPLPIDYNTFMYCCAKMLQKRVGFVWKELDSQDLPPTGFGKTVQIPETIFDRLYTYGVVRVGHTVYVPNAEQDYFNPLKEYGVDPEPIKNRRISNQEATAWSLFCGGLDDRMIMSQAFPAKATGTLAMMFHVIQTEDRNIPLCVTDQATGADAVQAGIAPDSIESLRSGNSIFKMSDILSLVFTVPYTGIESPDQVLTAFVKRSFRGSGLVNA